MQAIDPKISAEGLAIASGAIVISLLNALRAKNLMTNGEINAAIQTAMAGIGARAQQSAAGAEAADFMSALIRSYPQR